MFKVKKKLVLVALLSGIGAVSTAANATILSAAERAQLQLEFTAATQTSGSDYVYTPDRSSFTIIGARVSGLDRCGGDPKFTITNAFTDGTFKRMWDNAKSAISGLASDLPAYLVALYLEKSNPHLMGLLKNGMDLGMEDYLSGIASCEAIGNAITDSYPNDVNEWGRMERFERFISNSTCVPDSDGEIDSDACYEDTAPRGYSESVEDILREGRQQAGSLGINWFGGKAGGESTDDIVVVSDSMRIGQCLMRGISVPRCKQMTPEEVSAEGDVLNQTDLEKWLNRDGKETMHAARVILGEQYLKICDGCENFNEMGVGSEEYLKMHHKVVFETLIQLYHRAPGQLTDDQYKSVSAVGVIDVTYEYFEALKSLESDKDMQELYMSGLAYDVSYHRTIAQMGLIRQTLMVTQLHDASQPDGGHMSEKIQYFIDILDYERTRLIENAQGRGYSPFKYSRMLLDVLGPKSVSLLGK
ncbi:hypothetical protein AB4571_02320 [Vibrio breoganii]|uniref:hypothetical protein n=2 Tax=Vibrio TaxID=662 RepID=UPI000C81B02F|nr:hypothetical protein [Vibrio breoganii]PML12749.1 hypothetical protein BCT84_02370 [Vibrio breoganii]